MKKLRFLMVFILCLMLTACSSGNVTSSNSSNGSDNIISSSSSDDKSNQNNQVGITLDNLPEFQGEENPFVAINNNEPNFPESDKTTNAFETYSNLDSLGRCGVAYANVCQEIMPTQKRGDISSIKPSGWKNKKYDTSLVDGGYLYNRCHLIGHQLAGEDANEKNLITGTRYFNVDGMLPFENMVADYVKETNNHVLYRVTPIYDGDNLVAKGVQMEAYSVEDNGEGVMFNVFVYNVQPGIEINYTTGDNYLSSDSQNDNTSSNQNTNVQSQDNNNNQSQDNNNQSNETVEIRGNKNSKIYHCPGQAAYDEMKDSSNLVIFNSEQDAINAGYRKAKR